MNMIKAIRGKEVREFDLSFWNKLPDDKYGWKQAAEEPDEVKVLKEKEVKSVERKGRKKKDIVSFEKDSNAEAGK